MVTAREKLFGTEVACELGVDCLFGGKIQRGEDVMVAWVNRGEYPLLLSDIMSLDGHFEIYHTDCARKVGLIPGEQTSSERSINDEQISDDKGEKSSDVDTNTGGK